MEKIWRDGYEEVVFFYDRASNTHSIISIHDTTLGPALGGTRMYPYKSVEEALDDVLRLSKGMTYKAAVANLPLGGGKSVIQADPKTEKTPAMLEAHAKFVDSLGGKYITAEDSGTTRQDIDHIRKFTRYVVGTSEEKGGSGDPSPYTAKGVLFGMRACADKILQKDLSQCRIALQGAGNVGKHVARLLYQEGAKLFIADVDAEKTRAICDEVAATPVSVNEIFDLECDIFSPNALGGVLDATNISRLRCQVVAGAANNQLKNDEAGNLLHERNIFYSPDYIINAGGLISVCYEWLNYTDSKRDVLVEKIEETMREVIDEALKKRLPSYLIAREIGESRLQQHRR